MDVSDLSDGEEVLVVTQSRNRKQASNQADLAQVNELARHSVSSSHSSSSASQRQPAAHSPLFAEDSRAGSAITYGELQLREFMGWGASANYTPSPSRATSDRSRTMHTSLLLNEARSGARSASPERRAWDSSTTAKVVRPGIMMRPWQRRGGSGGGSKGGSVSNDSANLPGTNIWSPPPTASSLSPHSKHAQFRSTSPSRTPSPSPPRAKISNRPATAHSSSNVGRELPGLARSSHHGAPPVQQLLHEHRVPSSSKGTMSSHRSGEHRVEWTLPEGRSSPRPRPHSSDMQASQKAQSAPVAPQTAAASSFDLFNEERARLQHAFESSSAIEVSSINQSSGGHKSLESRHARDRPSLAAAASLGQRGEAMPVVSSLSVVCCLNSQMYFFSSSFRIEELLWHIQSIQLPYISFFQRSSFS